MQLLFVVGFLFIPITKSGSSLLSSKGLRGYSFILFIRFDVGAGLERAWCRRGEAWSRGE